MRYIYLRIGALKVYAEYPSVTSGLSYFDGLSHHGELLLWAGKLHVIITGREDYDCHEIEDNGPASGSP